jgi:hypothetical protein
VVNGLGPARNSRPMMGASLRPAKPRHSEDRRRLQADSTDPVTGQPDPATATREDRTGGDGPLQGDCGPAAERAACLQREAAAMHWREVMAAGV